MMPIIMRATYASLFQIARSKFCHGIFQQRLFIFPSHAQSTAGMVYINCPLAIRCVAIFIPPSGILLPIGLVEAFLPSLLCLAESERTGQAGYRLMLY